MELKTLRLIPDDPNGWLWWPAFEARVKNFIELYLPRTDPKAVAWDLRLKWIQTPNMTSFWLAFDPDDKPIAHMAAWIVQNYNKPHIFVAQAEADEKYQITKVVKLVLEAMTAWKDDLNKLVPDPNYHIKGLEMATWRKAEVWVKYLKMLGYNSAEVRSVIWCDLDSPSNS